ncbi:MAG TPA: ABC transporter permease subunit [Conexibacter sp.]|nr:ABC transporter permease subunit [Conexibacter sp.]
MSTRLTQAPAGVSAASTDTAAPRSKGGQPRKPLDAAARRRRLWSLVLANGAPLLALLVWWYASQNSNPLEIPDPIVVAERAWDLLVGSGASQTWTSFARIMISVALSMVIGAALVAIAKLWPVTDRLIGNRILPFVNSVPALGWAILGVIWFGVGNFAVVFVVTLILVPFTLVNLWQGMQALDRELREMGRSFTRSRWRVMWKIEAPLLAPYALAATRLSFAVGWKVALIAEFFGSDTGLGLVMNQARQMLDTPTVFAAIIVVMLIVIVFDRLVFDQLAKRLAVKSGTVVPTGG